MGFGYLTCHLSWDYTCFDPEIRPWPVIWAWIILVLTQGLSRGLSGMPPKLGLCLCWPRDYTLAYLACHLSWDCACVGPGIIPWSNWAEIMLVLAQGLNLFL